MIPSAIKTRWQRWADRRAPRQPRLVLSQRNIYIVPSRGGWVYAAVVSVLLLAAINEQLNLAYALAFLLGGVGLAAMWLTHANLHDLALSLGPAANVHAGQPLRVNVVLDAQALHRGRYGLVLAGSEHAEVAAGQQSTVPLSVPTTQRGWLELPRWRIESTYPLGLFRAWAYWRAAPAALVWPAIDPHAPPLTGAAPNDNHGAPQPTSQTSTPDEVREWRRGDPLSAVAWKKSATRLASGQSPVSRFRSAQAGPPLWIDWDATQGLHTEARLSRLAAWLVMAETQAQHCGRPYGLKLPGHTLPCAQGSAHLHQALDTLAQWGLTPPPSPGREAAPAHLKAMQARA